ncbi:hypothetical protein PHLGIDRAFT_128949 [Phlebiopsis gigantea 11061_1 CR5-6]|uniref:Bud22 domain-containing protein n=1 Tax=Phlebiopsis gigantea (strain 11061_1 CR5-6) TaxID=745531 RepID=A0A0C3S544_PHLG1|nr:hypothetical protein PHLGIDRAFT_128949 [Phlebiopsis gigantea 11061_1 CR5-6]
MPAEHTIPALKRKRVKEEGPASRISGKLHHCAREVKKAAKKAKDFEIRKLVKRLKSLRAKETAPPELKDLEEQLVILKDIDYENIANTALRTKLKKDKKLSENSDLEQAIAEELAQPVTSAVAGSNLAKVQGRLLSSKVVAAEVQAIVEEIRLVVFPEMKQTAPAEDLADGDGDEAVAQPPAKKTKLVRADDSAENAAEDSSEEEGSLGEQAVLDEDDDAVDDAGWESGSVGGEPGIASDGEESEDEEEQGSDEESDEDAEDPPTRSTKTASSKKATAKVLTKAGESTFLPSLSVGFTRGDSDASDIDDGEAAKADPRKNRRGQRARRAIWEKKYGRNANHVKSQIAEGNKDARPPSKRPASKTQSNARPRPQGRPFQQSEPPIHPSVPIRPSARQMEDKPIHPSWEAKRKLKEKQSAGIIPAQGKKIVF